MFLDNLDSTFDYYAIIIIIIDFGGQTKMPTYQISKVVKGTFHQGNSRFGNTAGTQCACNALFAIFWSHIRQVSRWTNNDLDKILTEGDRLYKTLNTNSQLSFDELPNVIEIEGTVSNVILRDLYDCEATLIQDFPFLRGMDWFSSNESSTSSSLMVMEGLCTAIFHTAGLTFDAYYIFDSHSRDSRGL